TPGLLTTFPMKMLQAGSGDSVSLKVFVISESRVEVNDVMGIGFTNKTIDGSELTWDFAKKTSNYDAVRTQTLAGDSGRTWLTVYSGHGLIQGEETPDGMYRYYTVGAQQEPTIAEAYFDQALLNTEATAPCPKHLLDGIEGSFDKVVELCPPGQPC